MLRDYFSLAIENLKMRQVRTWLTMIGIFIGIAAIVSLISLGQGMRDAISAQFQSLGSDRITIQAKGINFGPPGSNVVKSLTNDDLHEIEKVNGVGRVAGRLIKGVDATFENKKTVVYVANLPTDQKQRDLVLESVKPKIQSGRMLSVNDKYKIVVGNDYASKDMLGRKVIVGDKVTLAGKQFEIVGIMEKKGLPFIDFSIIMNDDPLREILNLDEEQSVIVAEVIKGEDIKTVAENVKHQLRKFRNEERDKEGFEVQTPEQTLKTVDTVLGIVTAVLIGIAAISLLVGGVGIMNTMYTSVLERTKEIGVMKAIGAKNSDVMLIFLIESGFLGMLGGIIGAAIGVGISKLVEFIATNVWGNLLLKASISLELVLGAILFSFIIGTLSGILPARQAANLPPVKALKSK